MFYQPDLCRWEVDIKFDHMDSGSINDAYIMKSQ